jgi:hypothetical protein
MSKSDDPKKLAARIEALDPDFEVVSVGRELEIVKQVGSPGNLEATYGISKMRGTHGLGHTRLSTESRVDLSHSQPFWAHGYPDLAIVHNIAIRWLREPRSIPALRRVLPMSQWKRARLATAARSIGPRGLLRPIVFAVAKRT